MHHNLEVDFLGKWQILTPWAGKLLLSSQCGHLVKVILVIFNFGNAVICSLYINIIIFIYSGGFDSIRFRF